MPWPLQEAISHGINILSWFENFESKELPNENLWDDGEAVEEHFKLQRLKREAKMQGDTTLEDEEMMGNDLADSFKD